MQYILFHASEGSIFVTDKLQVVIASFGFEILKFLHLQTMYSSGTHFEVSVHQHYHTSLLSFCYITLLILILVFNDIMLFRLVITAVSDQQVPLSSNKSPTCKMSHLLRYGAVSNSK